MASFNSEIRRVGFACKIQLTPNTEPAEFAIRTTTITWLNAQSLQRSTERLWELMRNNIAALHAQIAWVSALPANQRMFRISSDLLPAYTHKDWNWFYRDADAVKFLEQQLIKTGDLARTHDIRLSFHPGQFCVLASESAEIVARSIVEFEYHADVIRYLGYGRSFQDFKCNVHIGGKAGPAGIRSSLKKLSPEARNCITIENAEYSWGLEHSLELKMDCALVLDIHHHWIASGEYISPNDTRVRKVLESWRGIRPVVHYSVSRETVLPQHDRSESPDLNALQQAGFTSTKLRAHSEFYWNHKVNTWAASFSSVADIMCEAKQKNLASEKFVKYTEHENLLETA